MRWLFFITLILSLFCPGVVCADFVNPASLEITEIRASEFEIVLTLPLIRGRVLKAKPIFPDNFMIHGEATERAISGSVLRTWSMTCDPQDLVGAPIGVQGLLGTSQEILLTIKTLAGRSYRHTLRATQSFYIIPTPPMVLQLALQAGLLGIQHVLRRFELVLFVCVLFMLGLHWRTLLAATLTFALAQMLGQGLGIQNWMVVSPFWARAFCSLTILLMVCGSLNKDRIPAYCLEHRIWIPVFLLGLLYGASQSGMVTDWVLSTKEQYLALMFGAVGVLTGFGLLIACIQEAKIVLRTWKGAMQRRWRFWIIYGVGILAAALFWYEASTPAFVDGIVPLLGGNWLSGPVVPDAIGTLVWWSGTNSREFLWPGIGLQFYECDHTAS
ncbi:MAG: HupE/UreJ family protein [Planctomycetota bacterium]